MTAINFAIAQAVEQTSAPPIPRAQAWGSTYLSTSTSLKLPLLDLSQGVPKSAPHDSVLESLAKVSSDPASARYGAILGETSLREALAGEIQSQYRLSSSSNPSSNIEKSTTEESNEEGAGPAIGKGIGDFTDVDQAGVIGRDIGITTGCNMAFLTLMMTLCPPSASSILIPLPCYFNMSMTFSLQSIQPIYIPCDPSKAFIPSLSFARRYLETQSQSTQDESKIKPRAIVLISPNNPTGTVMSPESLKEWYDLAKEFGLALVMDETYRDFVELQDSVHIDSKDESGDIRLGDMETKNNRVEGRGKPHDLFGEKDWRKTLVSLGSFSKSYRIPGHRLGYIVASPYLLERIATVCDCMQICPPRPPQIALAPLLSSLREDITCSSKILANRRNLFRQSLAPGWECISTGGFFAYVSFPSAYLSKSHSRPRSDDQRVNEDHSAVKGSRLNINGSEDVARILAQECGVVTLPGSFFMPPLLTATEIEKKPDGLWGVIGEEGKVLMQDRWLRFAVANVGDEVIRQLRPRLEMMNHLMGF